MIHKALCLAYFAMLLLASDSVSAQRSSELSDDLPDSRTMAVQRKVEALFDEGDFERAFFIYRNELAPLGDKYAQYMVGYMYYTGTGVEEDYVAASAWYQLAAERGTPEFIAVRDQLTKNLTSEQVYRSDLLYNELRREYCDIAVLLSSIKRDLQALNSKTGSRLTGLASPISVIDGRGGGIRSGAEYYAELRERIEKRLHLLKESGDFQDLVVDVDRVDLRDLEDRVENRLKFGE